MVSAQVVEASVADKSPFQDFSQPDDHFQEYVTPGFKPFSYIRNFVSRESQRRTVVLSLLGATTTRHNERRMNI